MNFIKFFFKCSSKKLNRFKFNLKNLNIKEFFIEKRKLRGYINNSFLKKFNFVKSRFNFEKLNLLNLSSENKKIIKRKQIRAKGRIFDIHKRTSILRFLIQYKKKFNKNYIKNKDCLIYHK